jgi:hypothetical protein
MKRVWMAGMVAGVVAIAGTLGTAMAANPEPVGISLLRIEMKKALLQQDVAAKMTQLRQRKLQELQAANKTDEVADAEVDLIQAQTTQAITDINLKELDLQLKEALKSVNAPPPPPGVPAPGAGTQPAETEPVASPAEISMLQYELQKAKLQADAAGKIADNRQKVLAARQVKADKAGPDIEADATSSQANARMAQLDVEAAQMRLDAAVKSTQKT